MTHPPDPVAFAKALIACPSVTPADAGAQAYLADVLGGAGFTVERLTFSAAGTPDVDNLFATIGSGAPHLVFAGHTDVVPPGDEAQLVAPAVRRRGRRRRCSTAAARSDMKGGVACFVAAALDFARATAAEAGTLSLAITGDEEGPAINGTGQADRLGAGRRPPLRRGDRRRADLAAAPRRHDQDRPARQPVGHDHASPGGRATSPIRISPTIRSRGWCASSTG